MNKDKEYYELQIKTLERLKTIRNLSIGELHDLTLMRNKLKNYEE